MAVFAAPALGDSDSMERSRWRDTVCQHTTHVTAVSHSCATNHQPKVTNPLYLLILAWQTVFHFVFLLFELVYIYNNIIKLKFG